MSWVAIAMALRQTEMALRPERHTVFTVRAGTDMGPYPRRQPAGGDLSGPGLDHVAHDRVVDWLPGTQSIAEKPVRRAGELAGRRMPRPTITEPGVTSSSGSHLPELGVCRRCPGVALSGRATPPFPGRPGSRVRCRAATEVAPLDAVARSRSLPILEEVLDLQPQELRDVVHVAQVLLARVVGRHVPTARAAGNQAPGNVGCRTSTSASRSGVAGPGPRLSSTNP